MSHEQSGRQKKKVAVSLPLARINTIMKSSPEVANVSSEAVLLTAKAAEMFLSLLASTSLDQAADEQTLDYNDIARIVHSDARFAFLKDIIPKKITVREYNAILKEVEKEESQSGRTVCHSDLNQSKDEGQEDHEDDNDDEEQEEEDDEDVIALN